MPFVLIADTATVCGGHQSCSTSVAVILGWVTVLGYNRAAKSMTPWVKKVKKLKPQTTLNGTPTAELRDVTCHGITQCYLLPDTSERDPP